jgi:hypothetical protein
VDSPIYHFEIYTKYLLTDHSPLSPTYPFCHIFQNGPTFQNSVYHFKCFILVINFCHIFQNGPTFQNSVYLFKYFILVISFCHIFLNGPYTFKFE